ncbi:integumentary mucin C.1 [Hydra vulgaris]|uniref:Integumentary mucin C.1 n=1 Tax=Hydra vulgaris TaxID=6087 RepID=A0ABM4B233_HYDVU
MSIFKYNLKILLIVTTLQSFVVYEDCLPLSNVPCSYMCGYSVYHDAGKCQQDGRCYCWWGWTGPNAEYESETSNRIFADFCVTPCHYTQDYRNKECASDYVNGVINQTSFPDTTNPLLIITTIPTESTSTSTTILVENPEVPTTIVTKSTTEVSTTTEAMRIPKMTTTKSAITTSLPPIITTTSFPVKKTDVTENTVETLTFTTTLPPTTTTFTTTITRTLSFSTATLFTSTEPSTTKQTFSKSNAEQVAASTTRATETMASPLTTSKTISADNYLTTSNINTVTTHAATTTTISPKITITTSEAATLSTTKTSVKKESTTEFQPPIEIH